MVLLNLSPTLVERQFITIPVCTVYIKSHVMSVNLLQNVYSSVKAPCWVRLFITELLPLFNIIVSISSVS